MEGRSQAKGEAAGFYLLDPYAVPGRYRKAQLHVHSTLSDGRLTPGELARLYRRLGFSFLAFTDHDRVTVHPEEDGPDFVTIPGEECTVIRHFWPLGPHLLHLFARESARERRSPQALIDSIESQGGLAGLAHPGWVGNLGSGQWSPRQIDRLRHFRLVEIVNHFSDTRVNLERWHRALAVRTPEDPVWGIAVDDTHVAEDVGRAWVEVKVEEVSPAALHRALAGGHFYATTGPRVDFGVEDGAVRAALVSPEEPPPARPGRPEASGPEQNPAGRAGDRRLAGKPAVVRFYDRENQLLHQGEGELATYRPEGWEGLVRVEVEAEQGMAWSQPFWLVHGP
ncbi:MAG: CehA/McbA family metallohydrolase [Bacillota bacterium]|nr:CehA/McbA family metallohydrolase [Bacillota bacterium]